MTVARANMRRLVADLLCALPTAAMMLLHCGRASRSTHRPKLVLVVSARAVSHVYEHDEGDDGGVHASVSANASDVVADDRRRLDNKVTKGMQ